jgi:hypothetical protein
MTEMQRPEGKMTIEEWMKEYGQRYEGISNGGWSGENRTAAIQMGDPYASSDVSEMEQAAQEI